MGRHHRFWGAFMALGEDRSSGACPAWGAASRGSVTPWRVAALEERHPHTFQLWAWPARPAEVQVASCGWGLWPCPLTSLLWVGMWEENPSLCPHPRFPVPL